MIKLNLQELRIKADYKNFNLNELNEYNQTYLHQSIIEKNYEVAEFLVKNKIDIKIKDIYNLTAIDYIINRNLPTFLTLIILNYKDLDYNEYYFKAIEYNRIELITVFHNFNIIPPKNLIINNENILIKAIKSCNYKLFLVCYDKSLVNIRNSNNALFYAVKYSNYNATNFLLKNHPELINKKINNIVLLDIAFENESNKIIQLLLDHNAFSFLSKYEEKINLSFINKNVDYKENYPLHYAILTNQKLDLNLYNLKQKDMFNKTPLDYSNKIQKELIKSYLRKIKG